MAISHYVDSFAHTVIGRVAAGGPLMTLKVTGSEKEAKAFRDQHNERFPFGKALHIKPGDKPVVGKEFYSKRKARWHRGGKTIAGNA